MIVRKCMYVTRSSVRHSPASPVIGFFNVPNRARRSMTLESNKILIEMSS
jgi:hypothetical protein